MHSVDDLVVCFSDFNGHVGRPINGFDGVLGGYGVSLDLIAACEEEGIQLWLMSLSVLVRGCQLNGL